MKQYDSYKDSGVDWIGKIPSHWEVASISHFTSSRSGGTPDRNKKEYWENGTIPWMSSGEVNKEFVYDTEEYITPLGSSCSSSKVIKKDSVMVALNGQGKTKGMAAVLKIDAACNQSLCAFSCDKRLNYMFLFYNFKAMYKYLRSQTGDDTREGLAASFVKKQKISIPPISEQQSIADYLEKTCKAIDKAIATQEKRVDLLKELRQNIITQAVTRGINPDTPLKDSGVEWIGKIPNHWDVVPLKRKMQIIRGGSPRPIEQYLSDEGYNWIKIGDTVKGDKYIRNTSQKIKPEGLSATRLVHRGDLILSNSMSFGEPYIIDFEEGCIHDGWLSLSHLNNVDKEFIYYTLLSELCKKQFESFVDGGVVKNLNIDKAGYAIIFIPPLSEQQEIVFYIETKTARLDKSIEKAEHQIELLQELKQSIITEVVTGKRKVIE